MPTVVFYCQDYLKQDMLHIHRQVEGLPTWKRAVVCQKRENADKFWISKSHCTVLPQDRGRWFSRFHASHVARGPFQWGTSQVIRLLKAVHHHEADVVHIFFGHIAVMLLPFIKACPLPVVVSFHGADAGVDMDKPRHAEALREVFLHASRVFARSQALLDDLARLGCPAEKLRLQRTGVPLAEWCFVDRQPPLDGSWTFFQACRHVEKKGLKASLSAFRSIHAQFPSSRLILAGDGPLTATLKGLAREWGLEGSVEFPGFLDQKQLRELAARSHVFLHPSETPANGNREGVPNAMLEAMASGMPILATTHGGIPEAVTHGRSGFLAGEGDADALASFGLEIISQPEVFLRMARAAREEVSEKFDRLAVAKQLEADYAAMLPISQ